MAAGIMLLIFFSPITMSSFYLIFRPMVQPFAYLQYDIAGVPLTSIFSVILIASAYINGLFKKDGTLKHFKILPVYLLMYVSFMSLIETPDMMDSIGHILKILTAVSMYILIYNSIQDRKDIHLILRAYMLCSIVPILFGFYQYITGTGHAWMGEYYIGKRVDSLLGEYNAYGEFLSIVIIASIALFLLDKQRRSRVIITFILILLSISQVLAMNRGSWISLFIGLAVASFYYRSKVKLRWLVAVTLVLFLAFGGVLYQRFQELNTVSEAGISHNTLQGRITWWATLMPVLYEKPFFGHGIGAITTITTEYFQHMPLSKRTNTLLASDPAMAPHNDYLRLGIEVGILGLLCYVVFLLLELFRNMRLSQRSTLWRINFPTLAMVVYFIVISLFQNVVYNVTVFPMFMGLLALGHKANDLNQTGRFNAEA
jgi:O-antigen ligase